ncbi:MAG: hypothetical protein MJZ45_02385 [Bacteroidales bacterium]|nr:hypothetical protein [Bacteroidales bacterium]
MNNRRRILKFWGCFLLLLAVALSVITAVTRWHRLFPSDEVSEIYQKYAHTPGIDAAYVKGYRINDTLTLPITLLETKDTNIWEELCKDFGIASIKLLPKDFRENLIKSNSYGVKVLKNDTSSTQGTNYNRTIAFYSRKEMAIFTIAEISDSQYDAILGQKTQEITQ